jgi:CRP-like cAMP-binding protein
MRTEALQKNFLLTALSTEVQERLFSFMKIVELPQGKVIREPGETVRNVYFPTDAVIAELCVIKSGASAETSIVGNEGVAGLAAFMSGGSISSRAVVQNSGHALCLTSQHFMNECNRHGELMQLMLRYTQALITQISITAACNRHHCIEQQLCRWLLLSLDRVPSNKLAVTHEMIASILGVRREGISGAASSLKRQGVIDYCRGHISVLDRVKLERLSCECYAVIKKETDRLLPHRFNAIKNLQHKQYG